MSDVTFDMQENRMEVHPERRRTMARDVGRYGRDRLRPGAVCKRNVAPYLKDEDAFCMTYGDGVSDIDITASVAFHKSHGKLATITAVHPAARFGGLSLDGTEISSFQEKPPGEGGWINGGFFVLSPSVLRRDIGRRHGVLRGRPIQTLTSKREVRGLLSSWVLAADGYLARQAAPRRALGKWKGSVEDVVNPWMGRRVFLTGHTGFKGGWLALWLAAKGALIRGYLLEPTTEPNIFTSALIGGIVDDQRGDILGLLRSSRRLLTGFEAEVVFHLAASAPGAPFLCRPARHLRNQRDGHRELA